MMARQALFALILALPAAAQAPLQTTVRLVIAPTTVTDSRGRYIDGLTEKDFRLEDGGWPRDIHVDLAYIPMSLVVAVEGSHSSAAALNKAHKIGSMLEPLVTGERGEIAIVDYDSRVEVRQEFTADFGKVEDALRSIRPGDDGAKTIDAVVESVRLLAERPPERRRVLLLISETRDRGSKTKVEDAVTLAQQENVAIYPITFSAYATAFTAKAGTTPPPDEAGFNILGILMEVGRLGKTNAAEAFAKYTGGECLSFTRQKGLEQAIARIGEELHSQYLLSFAAPADTSGAFHAIEVSVPSRPGAKVRTRPGYWAAAAQP